MKIVTTTTVFEPDYPCDEALARLAAIGFDGLDIGFDYLERAANSPLLSPDRSKFFAALRMKADELGVEYTQAHAPFHGNDFGMLPVSVEAAGILGAKYVVVHPTEWEKDGASVDGPEGFIRRNAGLAEKWIELAEKWGVSILFENVPGQNASDPRIVARLAKEVGSHRVGWCFDTGHAHLCGFRPEALAECAVAPGSLHLQDNRGKSDEHLIPGDGEIDFAATVKALREIGYAGDCVLEAHKQCLNAPDGERDAILRRLLSAGRAICGGFEQGDPIQ